MKIIFAFLLIALCTGCLREYNCRSTVINPVFTGFTLSEIDTFLVRKFDLKGNFIGEFYLSNKQPNEYKTSHDTTEVIINASGYRLMPGSNWQIIIPGRPTNVMVTDIMEEQTTGKCLSKQENACTCYNPINSYKRNGLVINLQKTDDYRVYINR